VLRRYSGPCRLYLGFKTCCTNPVHTAVTRIDCKQPQLHSESCRTLEYRCACLFACVDAVRHALQPVFGCVAMLHKPCTSPVHTTVFRTACRQLQLTNSSCTTCYSVRMHACLRVLTRSDMPCSLYQWCTNPEQAATTQQPADSSKQLHLTKATCSVC
jgi:hypothetical protein